MKRISKLVLISLVVFMSSCIVSKRTYEALNKKYEEKKEQHKESEILVKQLREKLEKSKDELSLCNSKLSSLEASSTVKESACDEKVKMFEDQLEFLKEASKEKGSQAAALVEMNEQASKAMNKTLDKLAEKEEYIYLLQAAKNKNDSLNLALSFNLKTVLKDGIEDKDVDVKVDKTVVFINLTDKMLFTSGSYKITDRADAVLEKIAKIVKEKDDIEVMVEGYTDNDPINKACVKDNWELSVLRSAAVVKALQHKHNVDPNRLIAAGRGQYNALVPNDSPEGKSKNRRTRIIILPKIDQFYDLLEPKE